MLSTEGHDAGVPHLPKGAAEFLLHAPLIPSVLKTGLQ